MSQSSWLVAGMLPGIERQPRKEARAEPRRAPAIGAQIKLMVPVFQLVQVKVEGSKPFAHSKFIQGFGRLTQELTEADE
jgi:hypothetical protein